MTARPTTAMLGFDIAAPLPTGTTLLEASAGTGKTHTIGALVTRYVAEGVATLDQLLVVTFGRAASQELRERVREHLVAAERGLADPAAARSSKDAMVRLLADTDDGEIAVRRTRLTRALAEFDAATIATTHQFCQHVLSGLGVAGDNDADVTLVENLDDLVVEVVDDLYLRAFAARTPGPPFMDRATALQLGREVILDPQATLEPAEEPGTDAYRRHRFGHAVRAEVDRRKRDRGLLGYDDLLSRLATALGPDDAPARRRMRDRWRIVLVDEFQDTDPVQWDILRLAFAGHATLILVGDPKQAIYAFRGGDVETYLGAAGTASAAATLDENWRTDAPLVGALQALLADLELGDPQIPVRAVTAKHPAGRLADAPSTAPLRLRVLRRDQFNLGRRASIQIDKAREFIARDLAADIAGLLASGATFDGRPLLAGDVAVLVGTHKQAGLVREHLARRAVPAVVTGSSSVYETLAGDDWTVLLEALEQPHRANKVRAAALTPFLGRTATDLALGGEALTDELSALCTRWAALFTTGGVAALLEVATAEQRLAARLLGQVGGERRLTDLRHVGQGLHAAAIDEVLGLSALLEWLHRRRNEALLDRNTERIRRLDTDAAAVQVVTLHASKGLEFPVVYLPFAFDRWVSTPDVLLLHAAGRRVLDVGGPVSGGRSERARRAAVEAAGEQLRLLYVGLTRAQSQVVTWWAPTSNTPGSGLHRVLFGRQAGSGAVPDTAVLPGDDDAARQLATLQAAGGLVVEPAQIASVRPGVAASAPASGLAVGVLDRPVDAGWRRMSYSSLSAAGGDAHLQAGAASRVGSEPETGERTDEALDSGVAATAAVSPDDTLLAVPSPMADLPVGTTFGTLVHAVLETVDPQAVDLAEELRVRSREQLARRAVPVTADDLAEALEPVLSTPLGPLAEGLTLRDIPVRDRLAELDFELPLAGGDEPGGVELSGGKPELSAGRSALGDLAPLLRRHLATDDPFRGYADRLASEEMRWLPLRGYLTGSLDAVFRLAGPRYVVADYKTNWLGPVDPAREPGAPAEPLTAWHYRPEAMAAVMAGSDYPLQALLYCVALHRFLRWRQPGYSAEEHLGGVLYLFVRGMTGPTTPVVDGEPCGVFSWRPPAALVEELSALLDGGAG